MLERSFTVDVLKTVAAQAIVWHHLLSYGPMMEVLNATWPIAVDGLFEATRLAVQVFLVLGGYLAGQSVINKPVRHPLAAIAKRYLRLVPFYLFALAFVSLAVYLSRDTIQAAWLPSAPTLWQVLAHALLLHDVLGFEALSSGAWYVAIDFQLYTLFIVLCSLFDGERRYAASLMMAALCALSIWYFNRIQALDIYAIYFLAAYGLGVLAAWAKRTSRDAAIFWLIAALALGALWLAYRTKLNVALVTAVWLVIKPKGHAHWTPIKRLIHRLANSAYVLFLTHFGVIVLFSALWHVLALTSTAHAIGMGLVAWLLSVWLGLALHEKVEVPLHHWVTHHSKRWLYARLH